MFLLQIVFDGELVIPSPSWVSYEPQARIAGRNIRRLDTTIENGWHPTAEDLDALCASAPGIPRVLILNYPSNPTGKTIEKYRLVELADVAERHGVIILSDEIYGKIHHEGMHQSIVPHHPEGTIFSGGLSRWCGAGGWRLGLFVFPRTLRWLQEAMAAVGTETFTSTSAPIQYAAITAFREGPEIDYYLLHSRRILKALGCTLAERIEQTGAGIVRPDGAFYLFPDFSPLGERLRSRSITTSAEICEWLLKDTGVACLPGSEFGRPPQEFTVRIAYVDFDGAAALTASEAIPLDQPLPDTFLEAHCGRVVAAVDRLCDWVVSLG